MKEQAVLSSKTACKGKALEVKLCGQLDQTRGSVAAEEGSQNAGWGVDHPQDLAELARSVGNVAHRLVEVGVVEKVKELETDSELRAFPVRDSCVLHHGEIRVEVMGTKELVTTLIAETKYGSVGSGAGRLDDR